MALRSETPSSTSSPMLVLLYLFWLTACFETRPFFIRRRRVWLKLDGRRFSLLSGDLLAQVIPRRRLVAETALGPIW
jgi:hypothetical protein